MRSPKNYIKDFLSEPWNNKLADHMNPQYEEIDIFNFVLPVTIKGHLWIKYSVGN